MEQLLQDLRLAFRSLARRPMLTAVAAATLALAIGGNAAIFSVVKAVLLRPLPYADADRLVRVWDANPSRNIPRRPSSAVAWTAYRDQSGVFEVLAGSRDWMPNLTGSGDPESLIAYRFSAEMFPLLGVRPQLGRWFTAEETRPGREHVVVLSHKLWQRRFGADPQVVGRSITLDGLPHTVIGVMPPPFAHPQNTELWAPMALSAELAANANARFVRMVGRLKPGVTLEQASAAVTAVAQRLGQQYPAPYGGYVARVDSMAADLVEDIRPALLVLMGAVAFVLLIACANVSNIMLARAADRRREMAVRASLGADSGRLVRLLLTESVLLSAVGGVVGVLLAYWGVGTLIQLFPQNIANLSIPRLEQISVDPGVLAFAAALTLGTGILFGIVPALYAARTGPAESLHDGARGSSEGRHSRRFRAGLVVGEFALALVLTACATLLIRSFLNLQAGSLGFDPRGVMTGRLLLKENRYDTPEKQRAFFSEVMSRVRALPGVESAGSVSFLPLSGWSGGARIQVEGREPNPDGTPLESDLRTADEGYFKAMRIAVEQGRAFTAGDGATSAPVAIVNETFVRRLLGGQDAVGKRIDVAFRLPRPGQPATPVWREIVGVVADVRHHGLGEDAVPEVYLPHMQEPYPLISLVVRTAPGLPVGGALKKVVWSVDPEQPVVYLLPLEQLARESITLRRMSTILLGTFGGLALFLAAMGIYGVMAHSVAQRTRELGVRLAIGATRRDVVSLVLREGGRLAALGAALGLLAAYGLTRWLESLLFGISPTDPVSFAAVMAFLATAALLACWIPARRAARVDPVIALRYE